MVWKTIFLICAAWIMQAAFGYMQLKNFNSHFAALRRQGKVVIGRCKGKISQGVVLLILIDKNCNIVKAERMKGTTVLAKMKPLDILNGENLLSIKEDIYKKVDKITAKAINDAVKNYNQFTSEKEVETAQAN